MTWTIVWMIGALPIVVGLATRVEVHYFAGVSTGYWLFMLLQVWRDGKK